jgi:hypothetical protein
MKATTTLKVPSTMILDINLQMTIEEADDLLREMQELKRWPAGNFKVVLRKSLEAARASHEARHDTTPS